MQKVQLVVSTKRAEAIQEIFRNGHFLSIQLGKVKYSKEFAIVNLVTDEAYMRICPDHLFQLGAAALKFENEINQLEAA